MGVAILRQSGDATWAQSMTKLRLFGLTQYRRLIFFDADGLVMRSLDHLFHLPSAPVAMPRAYWLNQPFMCDALVVVEPSDQRLEELLHQAESAGEPPTHSLTGCRLPSSVAVYIAQGRCAGK